MSFVTFLIFCGTFSIINAFSSSLLPLSHGWNDGRCNGCMEDIMQRKRNGCMLTRKFDLWSKVDDDIDSSTSQLQVSNERHRVLIPSKRRRDLIFGLVAANVALLTPKLSNAAGEIDNKTGELFTPKSQMLSGVGSDITRGVGSRERIDETVKYIEIYNTRFITYLSRFLLYFDESASEFWRSSIEIQTRKGANPTLVEPKIFAQFAESVEIGLYDYFSGPYGSYSSVKAAKAGISSAIPEKSMSAKESKSAKQGILNLLTLLKARYTKEECKRQLAILFSLLDGDGLQPTEEITNLLAEADNARIRRIDMIDGGFGYLKDEYPKVKVESPPAIGNSFENPKLFPVMKSTGKIMSVDISNGGSGYQLPPDVLIKDMAGTGRGAEACALIDRLGQVKEVVVLKPGKNYENPVVTFSQPLSVKRRKRKSISVASASVNLAYKVCNIEIENGGNGYGLSHYPKLEVDPPRASAIEFSDNENIDFPPSWYIGESLDLSPASARVIELESLNAKFVDSKNVTSSMLKEISSNYNSLLPSSVRPLLDASSLKNGYKIAGLPAPATYFGYGYRGYDIFGGVSSQPITKGALSLTASEYTRLALSGAVSTIVVRTLLNPLELIKTKMQLKSDAELTKAVEEQHRNKKRNTVENRKDSISSVDYANALISLRGFGALFQAADATFLASVIFGSLGFGATELFRRSFTMVFFDEATNTGSGELTFILLAAASLGCILTSFVATPFEVLRVKSMGRNDSVSVQRVLGDFMDKQRPGQPSTYSKSSIFEQVKGLDLNVDIPPLYSSFTPVVTRELPFAVSKFLAFDLFSQLICTLLPMDVQVGVGPLGLTVSAFAGALSGIVGAAISHPADLILTLASNSSSESEKGFDWKPIVKELLEKDGGIINFYVGLPARATFFFFVIGLQFFFYDYVKNLFGVGTDDLNLVLDVFYAVRKGLTDLY